MPWAGGQEYNGRLVLQPEQAAGKGVQRGEAPLAGVPMGHRDTISSPFLARKGDQGMPQAPHLSGVERVFRHRAKRKE